MEEKAKEAHLKRLEEDGYTIVENAIEPDLLEALSETLTRLEKDMGVEPAYNSFEGHKTLRIYNLLAHDPVFQRVPVHANVLPLIEGVLDEGCLISSLSSITILGKETAQPIHSDDQVIGLSRPHKAVVCNSMWALTDFTEENGATRLVPGSHKWDHCPTYGQHYDSIPAEMPKGSVLVWTGSLWHGGGANRTAQRRVGLAMNYCAGFIRQQENQQLGLPLDLVRTFEPRLQELAGFGTYQGLIGHIDKKSPREAVLGQAGGHKSIWDHDRKPPAG
ncbi:phytanoyl-CoA dioxygenase family protein [Tepidicaulis sp. LMO-SS28]|uniref:phytanoyl-CoA dioxygenase family protein n=1 Tax=Tepidicaulis sp. LMO-SS28 TaxID=3447455 RepID=UPI003EE10B2C